MQKFIVSRDDAIYEAFPDVALTRGGKLMCVFAECTHHHNRDYTRIMLCESSDLGRTWTPKRPLSEPLKRTQPTDPYWNCPRISKLPDGRLVAVADRIARDENNPNAEKSNWLWFSDDEGQSWRGPQSTPVVGIVPDQLIVSPDGHWLLGAHVAGHVAQDGKTKVPWQQRLWRSGDEGQTWDGPHIVASEPNLKLCEGSMMALPDGVLVCFLRENSFRGDDAYKVISRDDGRTWSRPVKFPLPGCHRPVAGILQSGRVLITHRFLQGGGGGMGWATQNFFGALTDVASCLATTREAAHARILPIDFDRSPHSDTGYSGWVQFPDGEIYVVSYLLDDASKAHIRGYSLRENDFVLADPEGKP